MNFSDETLMAYADGELDEVTSAQIVAVLAKDAELAERVARHQALRADVFAAFAEVVDEPVPEALQRLLASAQAPSPVTQQAPVQAVSPLEAARAKRAQSSANMKDRLARWSWPEWGALTASLVVGVLAGNLDWKQAGQPSGEHGGLLAAANGHVTAQGKLAEALTRQLASAPIQGDPVAIGVSFRDKSGQYCRSFVVGASTAGVDDRMAGLACRSKDKDEWNIAVVAQQAAPAVGSYRTAAAELPSAVLQAIDERIAGQSLDAQAEQAAQARGWRP
ncbi:anti-sigma factor [Undibacterium oligocarboniphilum]|uniref:Anti-sigma factor n=1 Tax=Undibacterium oligocarboniphilum TaxID=666702 RepID=A0A850QFK1_9BURK|nr:hypothetical protein [Undibacterium oligocarboniphilum]MBC3869591.1 hypothetical protein [Undibacterium oligocarboniphilum]NVO77969.1 hypothetical protein [Undibacterium oligocarboniphilum]